MNRHICRIGLSILLTGIAVAALGLSLQQPGVAGANPSPLHAEAEHSQAGDSLSPATLPYTTFVNTTIGSPVTLDPHWMYDTSSSEVAVQVYETLVFYEREKTDAFVPLLAQGWAISPDGTVYTFTIRSGVRFHAGGTLTAEDVAYSFWRGMLQDRNSGPMWMLLDPLLGVNAIDDFAGTDEARCLAVKNAVTYDNGSRTVTFHLSYPFGAFLEVLTSRLGAVLDREWMVAHGGWGGDCGNWRTYHDPAADESILFDQMNGTGPFKLDYWLPGDEVALVRNETYWLTAPLWGRGPAGRAALERVLIKTVDEWATRRDMLLNGDADFAYVARENAAELDPFVLTMQEGPHDETPALVHPTGTLRIVTGLPTASATDLAFNYSVSTDDNPYIGSGSLDGDGIPPDFFTDIDVRKAFNYAFDWPTYINDAMGGDAIQRTGPIVADMLGYDPAQATYFYSPTLSAYHFQQAWGGQVWTNGFSLTVAYNTGNTTRQRICEILKQNVEAITDTFHVEIVSLDWTDYLDAYNANRLPLRTVGWMADYHHPNNWVHPYLHSQGSYGRRLPSEMTEVFDAKIDGCKALMGSAAHTCYAELQNMSYLSATYIFLAQPTAARHYERAEVQGWYHNPAYPAFYYYGLSKGPLPAPTTVQTDTDSTTTYTDTAGLTTTLEVAAGAVTETTDIVYVPDLPVAERPGGFMFLGQSFALEAYQGGAYVPGFTFSGTVTITLHYEETAIEDSLVLYTWDGSAWVDAACGPYGRDTANNTLRVPICHLSEFALFGEPRRTYLPLVLGGY